MQLWKLSRQSGEGSEEKKTKKNSPHTTAHQNSISETNFDKLAEKVRMMERGAILEEIHE